MDFARSALAVSLIALSPRLKLGLRFGQRLLFVVEFLLALVQLGHEFFLRFFAFGVLGNRLLQIDDGDASGACCGRSACCPPLQEPVRTALQAKIIRSIQLN